MFRVLGFRVLGLGCSASGVDGFGFIWGVGVGFRFGDCYKDPHICILHYTRKPSSVGCRVQCSGFALAI